MRGPCAAVHGSRCRPATPPVEPLDLAVQLILLLHCADKHSKTKQALAQEKWKQEMTASYSLGRIARKEKGQENSIAGCRCAVLTTTRHMHQRLKE